MQVELSWTIIPTLIIVVLFLSTARVLFSIQDAPKPATALDVVVTGHQFWWEFQSPQGGFTTANELHVPVSDPKNPTPTHITLMSADTNHSFWVPKLAGKTDLIPNRTNEHVDGAARNRSVRGAVRAILRYAARQDAAARGGGITGRTLRRWVAGQRQTCADPRQGVAKKRQVFETTHQLSF